MATSTFSEAAAPQVWEAVEITIKPVKIDSVTALSHTISLAMTWRGLIRARILPKARSSVRLSLLLLSMSVSISLLCCFLRTLTAHILSVPMSPSLQRCSARAMPHTSGTMPLHRPLSLEQQTHHIPLHNLANTTA